MHGSIGVDGRIERLQNFVVKAFSPWDNGERQIILTACHSVEIKQKRNGEISVQCKDGLGVEKPTYVIPSDFTSLKEGVACTEIIVENGYGNTVHRWVYSG